MIPLKRTRHSKKLSHHIKLTDRRLKCPCCGTTTNVRKDGTLFCRVCGGYFEPDPDKPEDAELLQWQIEYHRNLQARIKLKKEIVN